MLYISFNVSYSLSGDRVGDDNWRILSANVAVAQKHFSFNHRSTMIIPEGHTCLVSFTAKKYILIISLKFFRSGYLNMTRVSSPGWDLEVETVEASIANVVSFWFHKDVATGKNWHRTVNNLHFTLSHISDKVVFLCSYHILSLQSLFSLLLWNHQSKKLQWTKSPTWNHINNITNNLESH